MDYAVLLYFDEQTRASLQSMADIAAEACGSRNMFEPALIPPHITVCYFAADDPDTAMKLIEEKVKTLITGRIIWPALGAFPTSTIYAAPVPTGYLLNLCYVFNTLLDGIVELGDFYRPSNWMPHSTLAMKLTREQYDQALTAVSSVFAPLTGVATEVSLVICEPFEELRTWKLGGVVAYPLGELKAYRFTVIFAHFGKVGGGWLYARHKNRDTWETAGGHIEEGETPLDCARRELYEETGATKFFIHPAFDYAVHTATESSYGQVFYADVERLGELPTESEMREVKVFRTMPDAMTYPRILPVLYDELQKWLGLSGKPDEFWDVLDGNRQPTGRIHKRGDPLPDGDNHLDVIVWIVNANGEFLITRRASNKIGYPGLWEIPGGSVSVGEDSLTAAIREAHEESGIALLPSNGELFCSYRHRNAFHDSWLFRQEYSLADVVLQEGETIDARTATWSEISAMMEQGEFIGRDVFQEFDLLEEIAAP